MESLNAPQGVFKLQRFPEAQHPSLRAWDAADELLLEHLAATAAARPQTPKTWIYNDGFGALTVALHPWPRQMVSDSYLSHQGCRHNLSSNQLPLQDVRLLSSLEQPEGKADLVLIKLPKSLALLEYQLNQLRPRLTPGTEIMAAGMVKHMRRSQLELFEQLIGPTRTSLARKKARLIFSTLNADLRPSPCRYPSDYLLEGTAYRICNHANVFSRQKLDIGTRLFIDHIPSREGARDIIDLGCGNGIVGLIAAERNPQAALHFIDESYMAVASAESTFRDAFAESRSASFKVADCLEGYPPQSADLILNNPPFHQQQVVGDQTAWQMFRQSRRVLRPGGEFWVIGNRHLGYHSKLKRLFGNCQTVASNAKFVVLRACRPG